MVRRKIWIAILQFLIIFSIIFGILYISTMSFAENTFAQEPDEEIPFEDAGTKTGENQSSEQNLQNSEEVLLENDGATKSEQLDENTSQEESVSIDNIEDVSNEQNLEISEEFVKDLGVIDETIEEQTIVETVGNKTKYISIIANEEYVFTQDQGVKIVFTKLDEGCAIPEFSIEKVFVKEGQKEIVGYEFLTNMNDGDFEYNLTLPNPFKTLDVELRYAESLNDEFKKIDSNVSADNVEIKNLDHFTIFVVTDPDPDYDQPILINEFLVDPATGEKEWVELYNNSSTDVDLTDWYFKDSKGTKRNITSTSTTPMIIPAGGFAVFETSEGWLNNSGSADYETESITLFNDSDGLVDAVLFNDSLGSELVNYPEEGQSVARQFDASDVFKIRVGEDITKGFSNDITLPELVLEDIVLTEIVEEIPAISVVTNSKNLEIICDSVLTLEDFQLQPNEDKKVLTRNCYVQDQRGKRAESVYTITINNSAPSVNISTSPTEFIYGSDIVLVANVDGGNGPFEYNWFGDSSKCSGNTRSIKIENFTNSNDCFVSVEDLDGDLVEAKIKLILTKKPDLENENIQNETEYYYVGAYERLLDYTPDYSDSDDDQSDDNSTSKEIEITNFEDCIDADGQINETKTPKECSIDGEVFVEKEGGEDNEENNEDNSGGVAGASEKKDDDCENVDCDFPLWLIFFLIITLLAMSAVVFMIKNTDNDEE